MHPDIEKLQRPTLIEQLRDKAFRNALFFTLISIALLSLFVASLVYPHLLKSQLSIGFRWLGVFFFGLLFCPPGIYGLICARRDLALIKSGCGARCNCDLRLRTTDDRAYIGSFRSTGSEYYLTVQLIEKSIKGIERKKNLKVHLNLFSNSAELLEHIELRWHTNNKRTHFPPSSIRKPFNQAEPVEIYASLDSDPQLEARGLRAELHLEVITPDAPLELHLANPID